MEDPWDQEGTARRACNDQLQKSLLAVQEHEKMLKDVEEATRSTPFETPELNYCPIRIGLEPTERVFPHDLIHSDNQQLAKVMTVFVYLCDEINELKDMAETKLYGPLVSFGQLPCSASVDDEGTDGEVLPAGARERMLGRILPTLQELSNFIDRCYFVAVNLVQQVSALMNPKDALYRSVFHSCQLKQVFLSLGELLTVLITLDCIIEGNESLRDSWAQYKVMMSYARADPSSFGMDAAKVATFEKLLLSVDQSVMSGEIFKGCIEQDFQFLAGIDGMPDMELNVRKNSTFLGALLASLKKSLETSMEVVGTNVEFYERVQICGCFALYALYRQLLPANIAPDFKLHKVFWAVQKTVPWVFLCNQKTIWFPGDFILNYSTAFDVRKLDPPNPAVYRKTFLLQFDQSFSQRVGSISAQSKAWFILADSYITASVRHENDVNQALEVRSGVLLKGLSVAVRVNYLLRSYLIVHEVMEVPISKSALAEVGNLIELLKAIEYTYTRKQAEIALSFALCTRHYAELLVNVVRPLQTKLETSRKLDSTRHDVLGVISILSNVLKSSDSMHYARLMVVLMSTDILSGISGLSEKDVDKMKMVVKKITCLSQLSKSIRNMCDAQFLYFHRPIFSYLVQDVYNHTIAPNRLHFLVGAFADGARTCLSVLHAPTTTAASVVSDFLVKYRSFIASVIKSVVINPLCRELENDLRLHIHTKTLSHLQNVNPKTDDLRPLRPFLDMAPLKFLGIVLDIKATVSHYLDHVFYSLTTLALHDWRTYSDMKALAADKFGLVLLDSFLPMGSLDQGLDVLQIMRNINVFVSRFTYNMNMQQFIEYRPDKASKHINTINIQSIAASIRQHGLGVLNTTVNYTYQFLSQKFHIFSQFLYDDYIRAHLSREHRWFKKHKHDPDVNNMYPYERGLKFVREIRKLGINDQGKSFLDQFRILVTEIGNALGYVRMVRSASMYYCSEAVKFLPELDDIPKFEHHAGFGVPIPVPIAEEGTEAPPIVEGFMPESGAGFSEETVRSAKTLDGIIETLVKNFGEGSDYFKVLVNVFQSVLLTEEHEHLRTFFMIVPSMCLSWIDASLQAKDTMYKATRGNSVREMYFTDDGFAMGIAYCLAILKQTRKFESIYWFDSVRSKHKSDFADLEKSQKARAAKEAKKKEKEKSKGGMMSFFSGKKKEEVDVEEDHEDYEEIHTLQLTGKRLEAQRREVGQLSYSVTGATIFFKRTDMDT